MLGYVGKLWWCLARGRSREGWCWWRWLRAAAGRQEAGLGVGLRVVAL